MRIGELAQQAGVTAKTVRFYEDAGLLPEPGRTPAGYRDYSAAAANRLGFIRSAQTAGLSLAEIRSILTIRDSGEAPCRHVTDLLRAHLAQVEQRIRDLEQTRSALRELHARAEQTDPRTCDGETVCSILT